MKGPHHPNPANSGQRRTANRRLPYDTAGRLTEVRHNGQTHSQYTYDANGNRLSKTRGTSTETGQYDAQDRLIQYNGIQYTYTPNGERQSKTQGSAVTRYQYDGLSRLKRVTQADGSVIDYLLDGQGRRVGKKLNGITQQHWVYQDSLKPLAELNAQGELISRFVYAQHTNVPDYMIKNGATYRLLKDHLGSVRLVLDVSSNTIVQELAYDEFGQVTKDTRPGFQPFGYAGGLYDPDTQLVHFGAREYDAQVGRWLSQDPIGFAGGDSNLYGYVVNDPVNGVDPMGLFFTPDTLLDAGFVLHDLYNLIHDGPCNRGQNLASLGLDLAGAALPGVTGLGMLSKEGDALLNANAVNKALKDDPFHRSATFAREDAAINGTHFQITGGDGVTRTLTQVPGDLNGVTGRYEYIVDQSGNLSHQRFVPNGSINGTPNKP